MIEFYLFILIFCLCLVAYVFEFDQTLYIFMISEINNNGLKKSTFFLFGACKSKRIVLEFLIKQQLRTFFSFWFCFEAYVFETFLWFDLVVKRRKQHCRWLGWTSTHSWRSEGHVAAKEGSCYEEGQVLVSSFFPTGFLSLSLCFALFPLFLDPWIFLV